jgi:competence protein ComEC
VLLPGDVEAAGEGAILRSGRNPRAEILKVPHHGSGTSSTRAFLSAVSPRIAVLSLGAWNRFGFPDPRLPALLRSRGVRVFRTDRDGAVTVAAETGQIRVRRAEGEP